MGRLLDEDDVVDWLLKRTEMYDATGHFVDENVVKKNIESQIAKIQSAQNISPDGTLTITVPKGTHVCRVLVQEDGTQYGGLFYPDEDRKRGKWIKTISENGITSAVRCSECGFEDNRYMLFRYCPHCGADMRGEPMRLIDANALIAEMHNVILEDGEDRRTFYEVIERQPTIEERKRGEWMLSEMYGSDHTAMTCDKCNAAYDMTIAGVMFNFCPNCGAQMEGSDG